MAASEHTLGTSRGQRKAAAKTDERERKRIAGDPREDSGSKRHRRDERAATARTPAAPAGPQQQQAWQQLDGLDEADLAGAWAADTPGLQQSIRQQLTPAAVAAAARPAVQLPEAAVSLGILDRNEDMEAVPSYVSEDEGNAEVAQHLPRLQHLSELLTTPEKFGALVDREQHSDETLEEMRLLAIRGKSGELWFGRLVALVQTGARQADSSQWAYVRWLEQAGPTTARKALEMLLPFYDLIPLGDIIEPVFLQHDRSSSADDEQKVRWYYNHFVRG
ncbi:expressed protein [Chlorella variabilis]|uniref:Expressed protein n=1 Tax=Chlorella variabilis TaxID=554065 RepID=E1ZNG9_CHLVA|nr:expressed protein [Chlorella variabilis]EFN52605.1 expressed protein [Chlorella variabilis]|eukprot:XP_005844707.1 expressed protein [Chlorella variabilis]